MTEKEKLRLLLELNIQSFCDYPEQVGVELQEGEQTCLYVAMCAPQDLGKVIGKKGTMAQALRRIMVAVATKNSFRAAMDIKE